MGGCGVGCGGVERLPVFGAEFAARRDVGVGLSLCGGAVGVGAVAVGLSVVTSFEELGNGAVVGALVDWSRAADGAAEERVLSVFEDSTVRVCAAVGGGHCAGWGGGERLG